MEQEETVIIQQTSGGTLDRRPGGGSGSGSGVGSGGGRRTTTAQRLPSEKTGNGTSIVHQPLPDPPSLAPQPLSAAHFTQYRSPAPPTLPCCNQANQQSQHRSQNRSGRTPEKFFSTSSQPPVRPNAEQMRGNSRSAHSHTLDRRHAHGGQSGQANQNVQINLRIGSQTLDRRNRQGARTTPLAPLDNQHTSNDANKDMYAVTEL